MQIMKFKSFALCLLLAGGLSASCISEDNSDCYNVYNLALSYLGDGTQEIFPDKINTVDLYVFDSNSTCVSSSRLSDADVKARMTRLPYLETGTYRIVCIGNAYETQVENLDSKNLSAITFAAKDYINGETVSGNDSLYWSAIDYEIEPFSAYKTEEEVKTALFASSHYDVVVEVVNAPANVGKHPKIEIIGTSPQTDFNNVAKGTPETYVMTTVSDGDRLTTAKSNIMRNLNHEEVYLKVTGEDGNEVALINFAEHLEKYKDKIDPDLNECIIPFRIEYNDKSTQINITLPSWYIELVTPIFNRTPLCIN